MKLIRCEKDGERFYAKLTNEQYAQRLEEDIFSNMKPIGTPFPVRDARLLAPARPSKIIAVGKNYLDHIKEFNGKEPESIIIFMKPATSVLDPGGAIITPPLCTRLDYEGELAFVLKKDARHVKAAQADAYILGYTCLNDVTARDFQQQDKQWTRAKGFDTFCPLGPVVTDEIDPDNANIRTWLNGRLVQNANTSLMKWKCRDILAFVSDIMTLYAGDVITTGTPAGVGPMRPGDIVAVEIDGIGKLENVTAAPDPV
jgi:2-keto-4-pentenoate hydratase/2-oxohepta-3-ene-1,7-dioic acid hydratase in catechol pathway